MGTTLGKRLDRLQKRTARVVLREGSNNNSVSHLGWTKLLSRRQHLCTFIYNCLKGLVPTELSTFAQLASHNYKTRCSESTVVPPVVRTEFRKKSIT